uniref:Uncharacterized protein n=1 Tax=Rhizophora mucronata TaxID=61149 RepID=A0A2P2QFB6_RHIMU
MNISPWICLSFLLPFPYFEPGEGIREICCFVRSVDNC